MKLSLLPLYELALRLREQPSRIRELTEEVIANHETYGEALSAYKTWTPELARKVAVAAAETLADGNDCGLLHGIPVSVKDLYGVGGLPTFAGTPRELPERWRLEGPVVARVRQQLAPITGKTHTVEFAFGGLGVNNHWGSPRNPWDAQHHRCPGGSSSGAGVSLAEGSALLALGTDTAGSVRIPASMTGNVGLKTSIGRWSTDGIVPLSPTLDTAGVLARSVRDAAFGFVAIDPDWGGDWDLFTAQHGDLTAHDIKIGVITGGLWDDCDDGIGETVEQALEELQRQGTALTDIALPEAAAAIDLLRRGSVAAAECDEFLSAELPDWRDLLDPVVSARIRDGGSISAVDYLGRRRQLRVLARTAAGRFGDCDVLACPTVAVTPPKIDEVTDVDGYRPRNLASLRNTCVANFLGLCAITLPVGLDRAGLPVGLQLFARHCDEARLLAVGLAAERSLGTPAQRLGQPPLGAPRSGTDTAA